MKIILVMFYVMNGSGATHIEIDGFSNAVNCEIQAVKIIKEFNKSRDVREKLQAYCILVN